MDNKEESISMVIDHQEKFIKYQQEFIMNQQATIEKSLEAVKVTVKESQKTLKIITIAIAIILMIGMSYVLGSFFTNYFNGDYSKEIKEAHSNYNYNENVNTMKTENESK